MELPDWWLSHVVRRLIQAYIHPSLALVTRVHALLGGAGVKSQSADAECSLPWGGICGNDASHLSDEASVSCPLVPHYIHLSRRLANTRTSQVSRLKLSGGRTASQVRVHKW